MNRAQTDFRHNSVSLCFYICYTEAKCTIGYKKTHFGKVWRLRSNLQFFTVFLRSWSTSDLLLGYICRETFLTLHSLESQWEGFCWLHWGKDEALYSQKKTLFLTTHSVHALPFQVLLFYHLLPCESREMQ